MISPYLPRAGRDVMTRPAARKLVLLNRWLFKDVIYLLRNKDLADFKKRSWFFWKDLLE